MSLAYDFYYGPITSSGSGPRTIKKNNTMRAISSGSYPAVAPSDLFSEYEAYNCADWDGYGAQPISPEIVRAARAFNFLLPISGQRPDIAPGADGTIGFEWRSGSAENREFILIDVGPANRVVAKRVFADGTLKTFAPTTVTTGARALINELLAP